MPPLGRYDMAAKIIEAFRDDRLIADGVPGGVLKQHQAALADLHHRCFRVPMGPKGNPGHLRGDANDELRRPRSFAKLRTGSFQLWSRSSICIE